MVLLDIGGSHASHTDQQGQKSRLLGQLCFFCNCMSAAWFYVYSKKVLGKLGAIEVLAWSYVGCAVFMVVANIIIYASSTLKFICDDCRGGSWYLPMQSLWAVCYSVIVASCLAYFLVLWANQYTTASTSTQFVTMQPVASVMLQCILIFGHLNPHGVLMLPGKNVLGGILVVLGLWVSNSGRASGDHHNLDTNDDDVEVADINEASAPGASGTGGKANEEQIAEMNKMADARHAREAAGQGRTGVASACDDNGEEHENAAAELTRRANEERDADQTVTNATAGPLLSAGRT